MIILCTIASRSQETVTSKRKQHKLSSEKQAALTKHKNQIARNSTSHNKNNYDYFVLLPRSDVRLTKKKYRKVLKRLFFKDY